MNHAFILNAIQLDSDFYPELECHSLEQDEFIKHRKAEDEGDFAFVARYHEQYLTEEPNIHEIAEQITDYALDKLWYHWFWDRAIPLLELTTKSDKVIVDDAMGYADRRIKELEAY
jgi:hypothetical protein